MSHYLIQRILVILLLAGAPDGIAFSSVLGSTARVLPISSDAWTGGPANGSALVRPALFTHSRTQYAAYSDAEGFLVLAKRTLGADTWESHRTPHRVDPVAADSALSLAVDGGGWLHVAWNQSGGPLHYARSTKPGSLELTSPSSFTGEREDRASNPQFFLLPKGDLLCLYRPGGSGRVALRRYSVARQTWATVQTDLLDGNGGNGPEWGMTVDQRGTLHLAWTWSDTSGAGTSRGLAYARSTDGGDTWTKSDGTPYSRPITAAGCEYAAHIPASGHPPGPPSVGADDSDRPYIASCWSPAPDGPPQFQIMHHDGTAWQLTPGPTFTPPPSQAGKSPQRLPLLPPLLLVDLTWKNFALHLIYRDDSRGGRIIVATRTGRDAGPWVERELAGDYTGVWEPAIDPVAWVRFLQVHLPVQNARQHAAGGPPMAQAAPSLISSLLWAPATERMRAQAPAPEATVGQAVDRPPTAASVMKLMQRAADWQWAHLPDPAERDPRGWEIAPFYIGTLALDRIAPDRRYREAMLRQAVTNAWLPGGRLYHADDQCVIQAYLDLYRLDPEPLKLAPSMQRFDAILARPPPTSLDWGGRNSQDRWTWCDALFMAPAAWAKMAQITGDRRYLDYMNHEWWATTEALLNPATGFFFRDESFLDLREPNGRTIHWSRGNGWAFAGLCRVIELLPPDYPDLPRYHQLYRVMVSAVLGAQQPDGLWRVGLLDPTAHPARETSGSAFMTFGLAWGINHGLLTRGEAEPAVRRAWNALAECVTAEGKLEHVQPIGAAPQGFAPGHTDTFAVGAFLLAGSEVYRLAGSAPPKIQ